MKLPEGALHDGPPVHAVELLKIKGKLITLTEA